MKKTELIKCTKCRDSKRPDEFCRDKRKLNGSCSWCRACMNSNYQRSNENKTDLFMARLNLRDDEY